VNAEVFAEWLRRQGYRVVRTASSYWYEAGAHVYQAFPYHWLIQPTEHELQDLLRAQHAVALRYSTPATAPCGKVSYHVVCEGDCELEALPRQARQGVRKGLAYAPVEPIPLARLAKEGWQLRQETLQRQDRGTAETQEWWRRLCQSADGLPGFEAWGAIHDGELVAAFLAFTCDDWFTLPHEQSATAHLEHRVNNGIFYAVTHQALARPGIARVFFGVESLDAPGTVDEFKFRMGFTARLVRQRVVFHPWLAPLANTELCDAAVRYLLRRRPANVTLAKGEGMLRFYREGRRSPGEQAWPDSLATRRSEFLESISSPA
jgi:hypothetical protein